MPAIRALDFDISAHANDLPTICLASMAFSFRQYRLNHTCSKPSFFSDLYKNTMITIPFFNETSKRICDFLAYFFTLLFIPRQNEYLKYLKF